MTKTNWTEFKWSVPQGKYDLKHRDGRNIFAYRNLPVLVLPVVTFMKKQIYPGKLLPIGYNFKQC